MILMKCILLMVVFAVVNTLIAYRDAGLWHWTPPKTIVRHDGGYYRNRTYSYVIPGYWTRSKTHCALVDENNITVPLGFSKKSKDYCGIYSCVWHKEKTHGHLIYCQQPATFAECETNGINTALDYPECCWKCVVYKDC